MESSPHKDNYPKYRLRLFLSVDLAGSTAFKAGDGKKPSKGAQSQPLWVEVTRNFYRSFPVIMETHYEALHGGQWADNCPKVWKTVGDEIIFCCKVEDRHHLNTCVAGFLAAIDDYRGQLKSSAQASQIKPLNVKGSAWIAPFPHQNITVTSINSSKSPDQFDEIFEQQADQKPRDVDFLGNGIDCGFRVASKSTIEKCPISIELAYLLAEEAFEGRFFGKFSAFENVSLKGVLNGSNYPIFFLDTEENERSRTLKNYERSLTGIVEPKPSDIISFLREFMAQNNIEFPALKKPSETTVMLPDSYEKFKSSWLSDHESLVETHTREIEGEKKVNSSGDDLPEFIKMWAEYMQSKRKNPPA